jgi:hypothetical protein
MPNNVLKTIIDKGVIQQHTEEHIHPLAQAVETYQNIETDISDAQNHIKRVQADEDKALNDAVSPDAEHRISEAQRMRNIYTARIASKTAAKVKALKELRNAIAIAHQQHTELVMAEYLKRRAILSVRIEEAIESDGPLSPGLVDEVLGYSKPMLDVQRLDIPNAMASMGQDDAEAILGMAARITDGLTKIEKLKGETI